MDIGVEQVETQSVAFIRRSVRMDELTGFYDEVFSRVLDVVTGAGGQVTGPAFGWYHGTPSETVDVAAGFPVSDIAPGSVPGDDEVMVDDRVGGRAVVAVHVGDYDSLASSYEAMEAWMAEHDEEGRDDMWEEYLSDPSEEPDTSKWQTRLVLPVK